MTGRQDISPLLRSYLAKHPPLSREDEVAAAKAGDRRRLVDHSFRLAVAGARWFLNHPLASSMSMDDLVAMGVLGLVTAAERFNPDLGIRFASYAIAWVRHEIQRTLENSGAEIRVPVGTRRRLARLMQAREKFGEDVSVLSRELGWTPARVRSLLGQARTMCVSKVDDGGGLDADHSDCFAMSQETCLSRQEEGAAAAAALGHLSERTRTAVELRLGLGQDEAAAPAREVADLLGVSRQSVDRMVALGIERMRAEYPVELRRIARRRREGVRADMRE